MTKDTKENLIAVFEKIDPDDQLIRLVIDFIKTYDGTNEVEFTFLMFSLTLHFMKHEELNVKALGYDALKSRHDTYNQTLEILKQEYENIKNGNLTNDPVFSDEESENIDDD